MNRTRRIRWIVGLAILVWLLLAATGVYIYRERQASPGAPVQTAPGQVQGNLEQGGPETPGQAAAGQERGDLETPGQEQQGPDEEYNGERALADVKYQVDLGPRIPGSPGHDQVVEWILAQLVQAGWETEVQESRQLNQPVRNLIAKRAGSGGGWIIIGAHYDTRLLADRDPDPAQRSQPVPGANDGASGVAVLLELARTLPKDLPGDIWLTFFDAEDNGKIPGWEWILGSRAFVNALVEQQTALPEAVVVVDMIGDADLNIYQELNSDAALVAEIWGQAAELGYEKAFIALPKHRILDDHIPFLQAGIAAVDIIDFDYPYWHTTADTADKVSADSLQIVGDTLTAWLMAK